LRAGDGTALHGGLVGGLIHGVPGCDPDQGQPLELLAVLALLDVAREVGFRVRIELLTQETVELPCVWIGIPYHRCVFNKWQAEFDAPICDGLAS
jgi:hypothetical protein